MKFLSCLLLLFFHLSSSGQELPPFLNFEPADYQAGNQNWMLAQGNNNNIYIANGRGLLEYTGSKWNLYPVPNATIVRSVHTLGGRIYTGAYMEFGYWEETPMGTLEYTSLLPRLKQEIAEGEQIWHIESIRGFVVFQSFSNLYIYEINTDEIRRADTAPGDFISNLYEIDNRIFFQVGAKGLFELQHGGPELIIPPDILGPLTIVHLFQKDGALRLITGDAGFFEWTGTELLPYHQEVSRQLEGSSIFSALDLPGGLVLGTVTQGFFYVPESGELRHFHQGNGLLNNTVLSLFIDKYQNLWAGLDQGLGMIDLDSPVELFEDRNGKLGSVYCSFQTEEFLYVGTNQGLYYRRNGTKGFELIKGTHGQVWSLQELDGKLFCGHNSGTFLVKGTLAEKIHDGSGTWLVKKVPNREGLYIQGHYNGLSFLKEEGGQFKGLPLIKGFPHSARYVVCDSTEVWVGNEHKGVFRFGLSDSLDSVKDLRNYSFSESSGITSSIFTFNDTLYYSSREGVLQFRAGADQFVKGSPLARAIGDRERISGKLVKLDNEIWGFGNNSIFKLEMAPLKNDYLVKEVFLPEELRLIPIGNENISELKDGSYFLGMANGYVRFDKIPEPEGKLAIRLDRIQKAALDKQPALVNLEGEDAFHYKTNNLTFTFSIPKQQIFPQPMYSYRLLGQSENWSPWDPSSEASFENLSFGDYEFQVRGKVGTLPSDVASFPLSINSPWFLSWPAIAVYALLFFGLLYLVNKVNHRRHLRQTFEREQALKMKNMEAEREIIELQNKHLEQDMEAKNKELAVSTMNLIRKNEFLSKIKEELKTSGNGANKGVLTTIEKEITGKDSWEFFKEAFNNADRDFFKKMKSKHPELTSNDLKLCAYLRLNLSSKEIAPLLNISVKSVEIKRYRLRKKMDLPRNVQLTDYILGI